MHPSGNAADRVGIELLPSADFLDEAVLETNEIGCRKPRLVKSCGFFHIHARFQQNRAPRHDGSALQFQEHLRLGRDSIHTVIAHAPNQLRIDAC